MGINDNKVAKLIHLDKDDIKPLTRLGLEKNLDLKNYIQYELSQLAKKGKKLLRDEK